MRSLRMISLRATCAVPSKSQSGISDGNRGCKCDSLGGVGVVEMWVSHCCLQDVKLWDASDTSLPALHTFEGRRGGHFNRSGSRIATVASFTRFPERTIPELMARFIEAFLSITVQEVHYRCTERPLLSFDLTHSLSNWCFLTFEKIRREPSKNHHHCGCACRRASIYDATTLQLVTQLEDATETIGGGGERIQRYLLPFLLCP